MIPEDLLFWIAPLREAPVDDHNVLCRRHADAMVVPRGWTLDDRREPIPRLFMPRRPEPAATDDAERSTRRRRSRASTPEVGEQLQIDGTGEIGRPELPDDVTDELLDDPAAPSHVPDAVTADDGAAPHADRVDVAPDTVVASGSDPLAAAPWQPEFDQDDDLGGLLEVDSPLLARAFRGTGRRRN